MTSYVNAPATKMIATHCAVCARPLCDAKSVEFGIGPDCRAKYGFDHLVSEEMRVKANALVHKIALVQKGTEALEACKELFEIGFVQLANRILDRVAKVALEPEGDNFLAVYTPYHVEFVTLVKGIPGRVWNKDKKAWMVPVDLKAKVALRDALEKCFPGKWAKGPMGPFVIGERKVTA